MKFNDYVKQKKVKIVTKDKSLSIGLINSVKENLEIVKTIALTDKNKSFLFKNYYDIIRCILESVLALNGYKSYSHEATITYARESKLIDYDCSIVLNNYRELRTDIVYRGKEASLDDTKGIIKIARQLLNTI